MVATMQTEEASLEGLDAVAVAEPVDDPVEAVEKKIRQATIDFTTATVGLLQELLSHTALNPGEQARAMHLLEGTGQIQAAMLRLLGGQRRKMTRHFGGAMYASGGGGLLGQYVDEDDPESFTADAQAETFGNKALQQMLAMIKPLMQQGGILGGALSSQKANQKGAEIESLVKALAEAKKAELPHVAAIQAKLDAALAAESQPALPSPVGPEVIS